MSNKHLFFLLLAILSVRLFISDQLPLMDTSEARYGEMGRKMADTGNWVTPMFSDTQPFWGKPPLSFWSQAASMSMFGDSEWAVRFPSFIFHLLSCLLIFLLLKQQSSTRHGLIASIVYSSTALGFMSSGVVLTDPALSFSVLLSFYGLWMFVSSHQRYFAYLGFLGLGLGLLAKGPIALVLFALPVAFWIALNHKWRLLLSIPWLTGFIITLTVALPWYYIAEKATPGFIDYFIVGEHFNRYLVSDWAGDRYGDAHARPLGTIWLFLLCALFPWVFYGLRAFTWQSLNKHTDKSWRTFLWSWALVTPVFFTLAGNILWTYLLPCLVPWVILLSYRFTMKENTKKSFVFASILVPIILLVLSFNEKVLNQTMNQKPVIDHWQQLNASENLPLFYLHKRLYSGEFYSDNKAKYVKNIESLPKDSPFYLAIRLKDLSKHGMSNELDCQPIPKPIVSKTALLKCERI